MQLLDWNNIKNQFVLWYGTHKRLALAGGILILAVIMFAFLGLGKPSIRSSISAINVMTEATRKTEALNYLAEYDEQFSRSVNGVSETYSYALRETKKGANWKKETYLNDLTLLEAFTRNDSGFFHCVTYPERSCVENASSSPKSSALVRDASLSGLNLWEKMNILQASVSQQEIAVEARPRTATCVSYVFNPAVVSDGDVAELFRAIGGPAPASNESASALRTWIQQYGVETCFDDQTGIILRHHKVVGQHIPLPTGGQMNYASEDRRTITRLRLNPLLSPEAFSTNSAF